MRREVCFSILLVYVQVFRKLDEGHQKQKEDLNRELLEVKVNPDDVGLCFCC